MSDKQKFCGECGAKLSGDAAFCGECGAPVNRAPGKQNDHTTEAEEKNQEPNSYPTRNENGLQIIPLLIWAGIWSVGWVIVPLFFFLLRPDPYYLFSCAEGVLFWVSLGLIAASLLQWFEVTTERPTTQMAFIVICSWSVSLSLLQWMHLTSAIMPMALAGFIVGSCLAWIIAKQIAGKDSADLSSNSINKLIVGWAICGAFGGFFSGYFPAKMLIGVVLFIAVLATIVIKRTK